MNKTTIQEVIDRIDILDHLNAIEQIAIASQNDRLRFDAHCKILEAAGLFKQEYKGELLVKQQILDDYEITQLGKVSSSNRLSTNGAAKAYPSKQEKV